MAKATFTKLRKYSVYHLKNLAVDMGLLAGNINYEKFIILGISRSGSNLLRDLLNSHSQIITFGELFRKSDSIAWDCPVYDTFRSQSKEILSLIQNDPLELIETHVFGKAPKYIKAVGFKLFYYHAQGDNLKPIWSYFRNRKDLKIIHLKRRNILKRYVSLKKATETNIWRDTAGSKEKNISMFLDYEDCVENFSKVKEWEREYDLFFRDHDKIDVLYEKLADDCEREMKHIQQFLSVEYENVKPSIYKQSNQSLSEKISNYFDLKKKFKGTPWEEFFEE